MTRRVDAHHKWQTLLRMTTARGCTPAEAATAKRLAASLAAKWGFGGKPAPEAPGAEYDVRFRRAEQNAARRWRWEYRTCGKSNCRCSRGDRHGPYKYAKKRRGDTVVSIYLGR